MMGELGWDLNSRLSFILSFSFLTSLIFLDHLKQLCCYPSTVISFQCLILSSPCFLTYFNNFYFQSKLPFPFQLSTHSHLDSSSFLYFPVICLLYTTLIVGSPQTAMLLFIHWNLIPIFNSQQSLLFSVFPQFLFLIHISFSSNWPSLRLVTSTKVVKHSILPSSRGKWRTSISSKGRRGRDSSPRGLDGNISTRAVMDQAPSLPDQYFIPLS